MSFVQPAFVVFFAVVCAFAWGARTRRVVNPVLLLASYVFYGWVTPWFCALLLVSTTLDYAAALGMGRWPAHRRALLWASVVGNLGILGAFKYFDFFVVQLRDAVLALGVETDLRTLGLVLPVGISFYTFQSMSYTIDVYRGRLPACRSWVDFALYVAFFPQLVAGPIERATHLLPQLQRDRVVTAETAARGFSLLVWGAFQKVCVGDVIGAYVDQIQALREPSASLVWAGAMAFGGQILADFSGYTDMARGSARMLGVELVPNFHRPYVATSTPDFWRRWHTSLSAWFRDYLFDPLLRAGRPSLARTVGATLLTFLLVGLWHGPRLNFVILGLWHGTAMVVYTVLIPVIPRRVQALPGARVVAILVHHALVLIPGGLLFREPDLQRIVGWVVLHPLGGTPAQHTAALYILVVSLWLALPIVLYPTVRGWVLDRWRGTPWIWPARGFAWSLAGVWIAGFSAARPDPFVYFQF